MHPSTGVTDRYARFICINLQALLTVKNRYPFHQDMPGGNVVRFIRIFRVVRIFRW